MVANDSEFPSKYLMNVTQKFLETFLFSVKRELARKINILIFVLFTRSPGA